MVAIKINGFGGMIPALDDRLLDNNMAATSKNTWLYSGALIGIVQEKLLHVCDTPATAKTYRIPASYTAAGRFDDSIWLEFVNRNTDVIRSVVVDDTFDRYYWASTSQAPRYNTKNRLELTANPKNSTVTFDNTTDTVTWTTHLLEGGAPVRFTTTGSMPTGLTASTTYYVTYGTVSSNTFQLSTTLINAYNGVAINFTTNGSGTHTGTTQAQAEFLLGVPAPTTAPSVNVTGGAAPTTTRSYVYTWLSAYGEEGPPSPPVTVTGNITGSWDVTVTATDSNNLGIDRFLVKVRIYRTITSLAGVATYYLVAEQDITDTTYSDTQTDTQVVSNNQLQSTNWTPPPEGLEGWVTLPNGILAGWKNNEIWYCEPYRPHAWPSSYSIAVEYPIVGLGVINQTLVICTAGFPMTAVGIHPSVVAMSRLAAFEPCTSRGSIISAPEGVYYSSFNGLIRVIPGKADNITKNMVTKDEWQTTFNVSTIVGARLGTAIYYFGTAAVGVFNEDAFETTAFVQEDLTSATLGVLIDPTNQRIAFNLLESTDITVSVFNDQWTNDVFVIRNNDVYWLDAADPTPDITPYVWRSKVFQLQVPGNLSAMKVFFETVSTTPTQNPVRNTNNPQTLAADQYGLVRVYADGTLIATRELRTSGELWRLPGGAKYSFYQFEVGGRVRVMSMHAATSPKELASV